VVKSIWCCMAALLVTAASVPAVAVAEAQSADTPASAPLRALVLLQPEMDDVLDRIHGQTSDLRVELLVDSVESMPSDIGAQLRLVSARSQQRNVSLVIWFAETVSATPRFIVNITLPEQHRSLTRDLGPSVAAGGGGGPASAVKESAALVVRAAIQALLSGATIGQAEGWSMNHNDASGQGQSNTQSVATGAPNASSDGAGHAPWRDTIEASKTPPSTPRAVPQPRAPVARASRDWPWALGVEWLSVYDGAVGHVFAECVSMRAERQVRLVRPFVDASMCPEREIDGGKYGRFRIARQQATLGASVRLLRTWFDASVGAEFGVVAYERVTVPTPGAAAPKTHVMAAGGPALRLVAPAHGSRIQGGFVFGLDVLTNSMKIGYRDPAAAAPDSFVEIAKLNVLQPYVALGLGVRW
jgi:hypothetical protein